MIINYTLGNTLIIDYDIRRTNYPLKKYNVFIQQILQKSLLGSPVT